jgi:hypothetical protein
VDLQTLQRRPNARAIVSLKTHEIQVRETSQDRQLQRQMASVNEHPRDRDGKE